VLDASFTHITHRETDRAGLGCCGHPRRARWPDIFIAIDIEYPRSSESERIIARRIVQHR
jgi:hypothetical protein